jgi:hypothetical protein
MFFVLSATHERWHGKNIQANLVTQIAEGKEREWWRQWVGFEPLSTPPELTFTAPAAASFPDNLYALTVMHLYSARLISLLSKYDVKFECFPVRLIDDKTGADIPSHHFAFRLLETMECIDYDESIIGGGPTPDIDKLALKSSCQEANRPMFRLERFLLTIINSDLKTALENENITGLKYVAVQDYRLGIKYLAAAMKNGM